MTDAEVQKVIRRKVESGKCLWSIEKRIDKFGVTQPNIQKIRESGLVELLVLKM
jgi:SecD/SecF fusion protein